jgi:hypothetical protein
VESYFYFYFYEAALLYLSVSLRNRYLLYFSVILAVGFSGFRLNVGVDYFSYVNLFIQSREVDISFYEPLTIIFSKVSGLMGSTSSLVFLSYAAITLGGVFFYISHFSPNRAISIFLFLVVPIYYLATFNAVRQWAAIAMILVSLVFLERKNFFKMSLAIIIGCMLHISALMMCLLPLFQFRYSKRVIIASFFSILLLSKVMLEIIALTPYALYLQEIFTGDWSFLTIIYVGVLIYFISYFHYFNKGVQIDRGQIIACNMNLASGLILLIGYVLKLDFLSIMRLNNYFIIQLIILIPVWLNMQHGRIRRSCYIVVVAVSFVYLLYTLMVNGGNYMLTPYNAIFFP